MSSDPHYQHGPPSSPDEQAAGVIISSDTYRSDRIPPGQSRTRKWPVLDARGTPEIDLAAWRLEIDGLVERPCCWTLEEFQSLPRVQVFADMHCVTQWSRLGNLWEGVSTRYVLEQAGLLPHASHVLLYGCDGDWTTNLPLQDFLTEDALLADRHDGRPLTAEHGGPVRAMVPRLYAWKSAKWLRRIEVRADDQPGYWERLGYHMHGDPWAEERFGG